MPLVPHSALHVLDAIGVLCSLGDNVLLDQKNDAVMAAATVLAISGYAIQANLTWVLLFLPILIYRGIKAFASLILIAFSIVEGTIRPCRRSCVPAITQLEAQGGAVCGGTDWAVAGYEHVPAVAMVSRSLDQMGFAVLCMIMMATLFLPSNVTGMISLAEALPQDPGLLQLLFVIPLVSMAAELLFLGAAIGRDAVHIVRAHFATRRQKRGRASNPHHRVVPSTAAAEGASNTAAASVLRTLLSQGASLRSPPQPANTFSGPATAAQHARGSRRAMLVTSAAGVVARDRATQRVLRSLLFMRIPSWVCTLLFLACVGPAFLNPSVASGGSPDWTAAAQATEAVCILVATLLLLFGCSVLGDVWLTNRRFLASADATRLRESEAELGDWGMQQLQQASGGSAVSTHHGAATGGVPHPLLRWVRWMRALVPHWAAAAPTPSGSTPSALATARVSGSPSGSAPGHRPPSSPPAAAAQQQQRVGNDDGGALDPPPLPAVYVAMTQHALVVGLGAIAVGITLLATMPRVLLALANAEAGSGEAIYLPAYAIPSDLVTAAAALGSAAGGQQLPVPQGYDSWPAYIGVPWLALVLLCAGLCAALTTVTVPRLRRARAAHRVTIRMARVVSKLPPRPRFLVHVGTGALGQRYRLPTRQEADLIELGGLGAAGRATASLTTTPQPRASSTAVAMLTDGSPAHLPTPGSGKGKATFAAGATGTGLLSTAALFMSASPSSTSVTVSPSGTPPTTTRGSRSASMQENPRGAGRAPRGSGTSALPRGGTDPLGSGTSLTALDLAVPGHRSDSSGAGGGESSGVVEESAEVSSSAGSCSEIALGAVYSGGAAEPAVFSFANDRFGSAQLQRSRAAERQHRSNKLAGSSQAAGQSSSGGLGAGGGAPEWRSGGSGRGTLQGPGGVVPVAPRSVPNPIHLYALQRYRAPGVVVSRRLIPSSASPAAPAEAEIAAVGAGGINAAVEKSAAGDGGRGDEQGFDTAARGGDIIITGRCTPDLASRPPKPRHLLSPNSLLPGAVGAQGIAAGAAPRGRSLKVATPSTPVYQSSAVVAGRGGWFEGPSADAQASSHEPPQLPGASTAPSADAGPPLTGRETPANSPALLLPAPSHGSPVAPLSRALLNAARARSAAAAAGARSMRGEEAEAPSRATQMTTERSASYLMRGGRGQGAGRADRVLVLPTTVRRAVVPPPLQQPHSPAQQPGALGGGSNTPAGGSTGWRGRAASAAAALGLGPGSRGAPEAPALRRVESEEEGGGSSSGSSGSSSSANSHDAHHMYPYPEGAGAGVTRDPELAILPRMPRSLLRFQGPGAAVTATGAPTSGEVGRSGDAAAVALLPKLLLTRELRLIHRSSSSADGAADATSSDATSTEALLYQMRLAADSGAMTDSSLRSPTASSNSSSGASNSYAPGHAPVAAPLSLRTTTCIICMSAPADAVLWPCGHCACMGCAASLVRHAFAAMRAAAEVESSGEDPLSVWRNAGTAAWRRNGGAGGTPDEQQLVHAGGGGSGGNDVAAGAEGGGGESLSGPEGRPAAGGGFTLTRTTSSGSTASGSVAAGGGSLETWPRCHICRGTVARVLRLQQHTALLLQLPEPLGGSGTGGPEGSPPAMSSHSGIRDNAAPATEKERSGSGDSTAVVEGDAAVVDGGAGITGDAETGPQSPPSIATWVASSRETFRSATRRLQVVLVAEVARARPFVEEA